MPGREMLVRVFNQLHWLKCNGMMFVLFLFHSAFNKFLECIAMLLTSSADTVYKWDAYVLN